MTPPLDEAFVADKIEDALAHIATDNEQARAHLRAALAELDPERVSERQNARTYRGP